MKQTPFLFAFFFTFP
ncbi:hypothetical protein CXP54_13645 [Escherichia albertii]|uniref:PheA gene leader peptide n=3 Tax=Escherichia TaxID=561 RepID=B7LVR3_ESCF3|nr:MULTISPECIES: pheA operon leader peptide PheL [Escherichia]AUS68485.1 hypothetical protein CXP54_13645 [Escherichia albertii]AXM04581.1 hypothetical protein DKG79_13215 [Escherichia fergusonii]EAB1455312.1 hypothetical protein [Escherichia albertii]EEW0111509.1 hypothetical protein [Escherichia albertii]EEW7343223.1 hypothetical protein [Escherichia albertii]